MKVSICIPAFNVAQYVGQSIESALAQGADEVVLVDDGSTDETFAVASKYPIRIVKHEKNLGLGNALNTCIQHATGDYVVLLSADDVLEKNYLAQMTKAAEERGSDIIACHLSLIGETGAPYIPHKDHHMAGPKPVSHSCSEWLEIFRHGGNSNLGCPMFRRSALLEVGCYENSFRQLTDLECLIRLMKAGKKLDVLEMTLYKYRIRDGQISSPTSENCKHHEDQMLRINNLHYVRPKKIMFATPFYSNSGFSPYIRSLFQSVYTLARHSTLEFDFQEISGGSYIDHNRNMMADAFLRSDAEYMMFIDSDESWDVQGLLNIIKADVDVVGAAYPVKNNWENYGVTIYTDENFRPEVNAQGLIRAQKVPTGFMKIHRSVFEKLRAANPDDWYYEGEGRRLYNFFGHLTIDHVRYGEDISFNIRWQRIGGEIWVEPRVSMGHYGAQGWFGNYHNYLRKQAGGDLEVKQAA